MSTSNYRGFSNLQTKSIGYDSESDISVYDRAMGKLRILSCVMIAVGSVLMFAGVVIVANMGSHAMFPFTSGSQIWSGFVVLAQGILGFFATTVKVDTINDNPHRLLKRLFSGFYGFLITSFSTNGINFGYSISGILICSQKTCANNDTLMIVMSVFGTVFGFCAYICTFLGMIFVCKYRRRFSVAPPERKKITVFNQSNAYGSSTNTLTFSTPQSSPPPPYSEKN